MSLKQNQKILITPYGSNIKYYKDKGYEFSKGESILVPVEDLPKNKTKVILICDCCGKEYEVEYKAYLMSKDKHNGKTYCIECYNTNPDILKYRQEKKITGVRKKYGVDNVFSLSEVKNKIKDTCLEKYGCENPMQNPDILEKTGDTNLERYGFRVALNNPEIYAKAQESLYNHGTQKCSQQQYAVFSMLNNFYKDNTNCEECVLNKPVSSCFADISLIINSVKIDIEYDGKYWHQDTAKDRRRDEFFKSQDYKILRIKSLKMIPSQESLLNSINELINSDSRYLELILQDYNNN